MNINSEVKYLIETPCGDFVQFLPNWEMLSHSIFDNIEDVGYEEQSRLLAIYFDTRVTIQVQQQFTSSPTKHEDE